MSKEQQDELKAVDGWIMAAQVAEGKRTRSNIKPRDPVILGLCTQSDLNAAIQAAGGSLTPPPPAEDAA